MCLRGHALCCHFKVITCVIRLQDSFFWTAMMCASSAGQRAAVRLLLGRGAAWVGVVDTRGRDARELAHEGTPRRSHRQTLAKHHRVCCHEDGQNSNSH